jgi:hypothetical protein
MLKSAQVEVRSAGPKAHARLSWTEAVPLIGLLSALCWAVVIGIALAIRSAF